MKVIEDGHIYALRNEDGDSYQVIKFVRRIPEDQKAEGILCQELLRVLIDRVFFLYRQVPCDEDTAILDNLRECLLLFESRAVRRKLEKMLEIEKIEPCNICGHILCEHNE